MITNVINRRRRAQRLLLLLGVLLPLSMLVALGSGAVQVAPADTLAVLMGGDRGQATVIVQQIRLPRVLLAAII
ncbi:MAG: iron ABC transporter permease, partial [Haliea sp.]|nr:iron ABC transporter permease [Haliea sp.]